MSSTIRASAAILIALLLSAASTDLFAQGSNYNFIGFGTPLVSADPTIEALGGAGAALEGSRVVNDINPADWTWLTRARFGIALDYDYAAGTFGTQTDQQFNINFKGISFGVPFWSALNASLALGYLPLTNANAKMERLDTASDTLTYVSKGGANMLFLGAAFRPFPALAFGVRADLITGNIRHQDRIMFFGRSDSADYERDYTFYGLRPTFGLQIIGDSIGIPGLTLGAAYSLAASMTATRETIITPSSSTLDTTIDESGNAKYPASFQVGLSQQFSHRYRAEVDYGAKNFDQTFVYSPTTDVPVTQNALQNSYQLSVGIERLPNVAGEFGTSLGMDKWGLRLGFYYSQLPYQVSPPARINVTAVAPVQPTEYALAAGVGIPVSYETLLNFSIVGGQRTSTNLRLAPKETFFRLGASVGLSDRWFVPTRRD